MSFHLLIGTPRLRDGRIAAPCVMMVFDSRDFLLVRFTIILPNTCILEPTRNMPFEPTLFRGIHVIQSLAFKAP
jgi:hypothetical protein